MKLRLENLESITLLSISEEINLQDLPVLSAGIQKIIQDQQEKGEKKHVALDLSSIDESQLEQGVQQEILRLRAVTANAGVALALISPIPGLGDVPSRESIEEYLSSPASRFMMIELRLKAHYQALQDHRAKLADEIEKKQNSQEEDVKSLRKKNDDLKARVAHLETLIRQQLQSKKNPIPNTVFSSKLDAAKKTAISVLEQEGILAVT